MMLKKVWLRSAARGDGRLDRRFHLGLVLRVGDAGGDHDRSVMPGHLMIGRVDVRFIVAGFADAGLEIVRNQDLRDPAEESKRTDMGLDPGRKITRESGPGKGVTAGAQGGHKEPGFSGGTGDGIRHRDRLAGIIDKELLTGSIDLTKTDIQLPSPLLIMETKLAVLIPVRVGLPVFQPQKTQRYPLTGQLPAEILHRRQSPFFRQRGRGDGKQESFQTAVIEIGWQRPSQTGALGAFQVFSDRAAGNVAAFSNLFVGQLDRTPCRGLFSHFNRKTSFMVRMEYLSAAIVS
jgi:hypothetical protein